MSRDVIIIVRDDLDGTDAAETIEFAVRGISYAIDLSEANVELFEKSMQQFVDAARIVKTTEQPKRRPPGTPTAHRVRLMQSRAIREWARNNGFDVGDKGVIAEGILAAWQEEHPGIAIIPATPQATRQRDEPQSITAQEAQMVLSEFAESAPPSRNRKAELHSKARRERMRAWALDNGFDQAPTGLVKKAVIAAYSAAHPEDKEN